MHSGKPEIGTAALRVWLGALFALLLIAPVSYVAASPATSFENNEPMQLKDGWFVYRDQIVDPTSLAATACGQEGGEAVSAPDVWGPAFTTSLSTGHGKATYCREITLPQDDNAYAFWMGTLRSVSHIYAVGQNADGSPQTWLLFKNGELEPEGDQVVANPATPMIALPYDTDKFTLVIQLSNYIHKQGGMIEVPLLDLRWRMAAMENRATGLPSALVIVLLFVGIAAIVMGYRRRTARSHNFFALLAIAAAVRAAFVSDLIWDYLPSFSLARKYDLEYLSLYFIAFAYYLFVTDLLRQGRRLLVDKVIIAISCAMMAFALLVTPFMAPGTITLTREPVQILWMTIICMVIYSVFHASIKTPEVRREAISVSLGGLIYGGYEILSVTGVVASSLEWSQFIIFAVIMMHAHAFVIQARRVEQERDILMASLEDTNRDLQNRALALDVALKDAEQASNAKSHFLATFSHELRTPLNAIIGFSELMSRELLGKLGNTLYKDYARDIHASGTHLLELVDDLLDLARIEAGVDEVKSEPMDVAALAVEVLNILSLLAEQHDVTMKLDCKQKLPLLLGDERKIRQVLINLINNAIKFNVEKGKIDVRLWADEAGLNIEVADTGIGIAEADLPLVLSRFGQVDSERRRRNAGVGIGLPLSGLLVRQHGGKFDIASKLGEGTRITICFPPDRLAENPQLATAG
ncbi:sensor histidine kinase [Kordiimonas lipolytica]|uniref:histidine kinase n=1 Tax=Kordiimonas lipolytica TaxID=1662421 RepID=A0ABV8UD20_9PROT